MAKIEYKKGNLIDALLTREINCLIHQANCYHTFGGGIAKEIAQRIPSAYEADLLTPLGESKLGDGSVAELGPNKCVVNLYSQGGVSNTKRMTNYGALALGLTKIADGFAKTLQEADGSCVIGMPRIGCGLGGGDWEIVSEIIEFAFRNFKGKVVVYDL